MSCCFPDAERSGIAGVAAHACGLAPRVPARLVTISGGLFTTGTNRPLLRQDGEGHRRTRNLKPFAIDPFAVTNAWFADFVESAGYVTESERLGWSPVFRPGGPVARAADAPSWWVPTEGASWRHPLGPGSEAPDNHPVVQVSYTDACAFAAWAGGRLPSEAEWECAAAGGLKNAIYPWGDREPDDTQFLPCNIWQGSFPTHDTAADGHAGTAPVDAYAPNGSGLHNMVGNTWEWCVDLFRVQSLANGTTKRNAEARSQGMRVLKGGSHLCHRSYCHRYRIAARSGAPPDTATTHVGFRLVFDLG